jgi:hypothetical protein
MSGATTSDVWEAMSTARTIRRFTGSYCGEQLLREAVGMPEDWMIAGHVVVGWPKGKHGPVRRRPLADVVNVDHWDQPFRQKEKRWP